MRRRNHLPLLFILGLLSAIGPFSIDMYLPAFPAIAEGLHTTIAKVMLSLSTFLIGISVGQLVYGPMLERFGRKRPLYVGLTIYMVASLGCALSASVDELIAFRLLQALGGCAGMVTARAIVRDTFEVKENAKIFATLMLIVAVSPIIAPTVGGYVTAALDWRWVFAMLMVVDACILTGVWFLLPESKQPDPHHSLKPAHILRNYGQVLSHPEFYVPALTSAVAYAGLTAYLSGSPYVYISIFHVSEKRFGWIFAVVAAGVISASQVNTLALRKFTSQQMIRFALTTQSITGIVLVTVILFGVSDPYLITALLFVFLSCQGLVFPNASALSLSAFGHNAGNASALMGGLQMSIGALGSALVSFMQQASVLPMAGVMAVCSVSAFALFTFGSKVKLKKPSDTVIREEDVDMVSGL